MGNKIGSGTKGLHNILSIGDMFFIFIDFDELKEERIGII